MSKDSSVSWCDSSSNPMMGCDGCELRNLKRGIKKCYAGTMTDHYGGRKGWPVTFETPQLFPERMKEALKWKDLTGTDRAEKPWLNGLPRIIFLNDMGDTFTKSLPLYWLADHLPEMSAVPHQWLVLTKCASRMIEFSTKYPFPLNVWPGVSVTSQMTVKRVDALKQVKGGGPKFVSLSPMWGRVRFTEEQLKTFVWLILECESDGDDVGQLSLDGSVQTEREWIAAAEEVVDQCDSQGVRVFVKQIPSQGKILLDVAKFPKKLQRREYP